MSVFDSILITGGGGMLAHALLRGLRARQTNAVALDRATCDITQPAAVAAAFESLHPTLVFNCAAHTRVDLCEEQEDLANAINGHAVADLARQAQKHGSALVHFSTDFVFDGSANRPLRPDDPTGPLGAYGRSKLLGERLLQEKPPDRWLIIRTAWLYGRNGLNFVRTMVERARSAAPLKVVADQIGSPTYTDDLAAAVLDLVERNARGVFHIVNSGQTSWHELACAAIAEFGLKHEVQPTTTEEWFKIRPKSAVRPRYSVLDVKRFEVAAGRKMRNWTEALRDYAVAVGKDGF